ncbi:hypothetical protein GGR58DRAFT_501797 [Xylaria digitata]|nr:hypothetical protein GGR58DRAFT_501797 [Xylaria digitata]
MATSDTESSDDWKVLHAGIFLMGTHSMAKVYSILGFKPFHALDEPWRGNWVELEKAAEATWLPGNEYEVVYDTPAPFTLELFGVYPNVKVVIVQRDYDSWWLSFESEILNNLFVPFFEF